MIRRSLCLIVVAFALAIPVAASGQTTPAHPGVVSGVVFHDRNLNGVRDPNEEGLPGWEIDVLVGDKGVSSGYSGTDGEYRIEGLASTLAGWQLDASQPFEIAVTRLYKVELPQPAPFTFYGDSARTDIPVAWDDNTSVTFRVWEDFDNSGTISAGDQIALYTDAVIETPDGSYVAETSGPLPSLTLTGLLPGDYVATAATDPLNRVLFTIPRRRVPVRPVELLEKPEITIYGYVYQDSDQSGTYDVGEPRLANAEVEVDSEGDGGVGMEAGADGSFVDASESNFKDQDVHIGCGNAPPFEPPGPEAGTDQQGYWRGAKDATETYTHLWFSSKSIHIDGPGRYRIDCGLVWIPPRQWQSGPPSPPRPGGEAAPRPEGTIDITLPPSGTGDSARPRLPSWPALTLLASGALLAAIAPFCKSKRPDPLRDQAS